VMLDELLEAHARYLPRFKRTTAAVAA
jgi:hypothetical protein